MAERQLNSWKRTLVSYNPNFRIDSANPQMGQSGTDVYKIYGVTDTGDCQSSISLSSGGMMDIMNDRSIVISGGTVNGEGAEDVVIIGQNGNISISAPNGKVRILAKDIMVDAERDLHLKAGRNINIKAVGGKITQESQKQDILGTSGNLITQLGMDFATQVFDGSFVGGDFLGGVIGPIAGNVVNSVLDTATGGLAGGLVGGVVGGVLGGGGIAGVVGNVAGGVLGGGGIGGIVGDVAGGVLGDGLGGIVGDVAGGALTGNLGGALTGVAGGLVGDVAGGVLGDGLGGVVGDIAGGALTGNIGGAVAGVAGGLVGDVAGSIGDRVGGDVAGNIARKYATKQFG